MKLDGPRAIVPPTSPRAVIFWSEPDSNQQLPPAALLVLLAAAARAWIVPAYLARCRAEVDLNRKPYAEGERSLVPTIAHGEVAHTDDIHADQHVVAAWQ